MTRRVCFAVPNPYRTPTSLPFSAHRAFKGVSPEEAERHYMQVRTRSALLAALGLALSGLLACGATGTEPESDAGGSGACPTCYLWKPLRIGAGGWVTGLDVSVDGSTRVVRTDTYGAYVWDSGQWKQLVTSTSMPAEDVGVDKGAGVYEIRVAPGNASRLYMAYRGFVYRSNDRGAHWTRTTFAQVPMEANDSYRMFGQKMAVDPANPDVVYVGTAGDGLFLTTDGGTSWQAVSAVPAGQTGKAGITGIAFDRSSGTAGGRTNTLYASSYGNAVYRSTNAGASWAPLSGEPATVKHAAVAADGVYYAVGDDGGAVWRCSGGVWANITPPSGQSYHSVMPDPFDAARIVVATDGGSLSQSLDRGATWGDGINWNASRSATDIPWLAWTKEDYMSNGDMVFDPVVRDKMWFAEGIGVWTTSVPRTLLWDTPVVWSSQSMGIEQLVANDIAAPPGGQPVVASWDRPLFHVADPDVFPSRHGVDNANAIVMGWSVDYASSDPTFLVALVNWWGVEQDGYSTDGGRTWTVFPTFPAWDVSNWPIGGSITASSPDNIVWVPANRKAPYYTKDRGLTWRKVVLPGVPDAGGWDGTHWAYYLNRHIVVADRVNPDTFYFYNYPYGLFRTTNKGDTWTPVFSGEIAPSSGYNAKLKSVPGKAGHLFFTSGQLDGGVSGPFMHSTNGGMSWSAVPNVLEVYAFGFGKEAPSASYPALYIVGWVNNAYGVWRSDDEGQSWTQIGDYPLGSLDQIRTVDGDKNTYGTVYLGFAGSGYGCRRPI